MSEPANDYLRMLQKAAVYQNSSRSASPWAQSTGFRTMALKFNALSLSDQPRLADEFLVNTRLERGDPEGVSSIQSFFSDVGVVMLSLNGRESASPASEVGLPPSSPLDMALGDTIACRRTSRLFTGDPIGFGYLAAILRAAGGVTGHAEAEVAGSERCRLPLRATPSAGGLYPIELYAAALNVEGLPRGLYRHDPLRDVLVRAGDSVAADRLLSCFSAPDEFLSVSRAAVVFLLVGRPWRAIRKYGDRGLRFVFLEAGAMAEHINLATAALGFGSADCASIYDHEVHEVLGLDGNFHALLHSVVVGCTG